MDTKRDLAAVYIKCYPELQNRTIARLLNQQHPETFTSVENARTTIRSVVGAKGDVHRHQATPDLIKPHGKAGETLRMPGAVLPVDRSPVELQGKRIGVLSDIHIPFHDTPAIMAALEAFERFGVDSIYLNGDTVDFPRISRFVPRADAPRTNADIGQTVQFLAYLRQRFAQVDEIHFKKGNHEERLEQFLATQAEQLADLEESRLEHLLDLEGFGITCIGDKRPAAAGKLLIFHGHERRQGITPAVNAARGLFLWAKASVLAGHNHQTSEHSERDVHQSHIGCWSTGCLCELQPDYDPWNTKHNHGFAIVEVGDGGEFRVLNHRVINGKVF